MNKKKSLILVQFFSCGFG